MDLIGSKLTRQGKADVKDRTQKTHAEPIADVKCPVSSETPVSSGVSVSSGGTNAILKQILDRALSGEKLAMRLLHTTLEPVIRARAHKVLALLRTRGRRGDLDEICQEIWVHLLSDDARVLRNYAPTRGMGLLGYVGLVTERAVISMLRGQSHALGITHFSLGHEDEDIPNSQDEICPESRYTMRERGRRLLAKLREAIGPKGALVLELSFIQGRPIEEICAALDMTEEAVYAWRSRIVKRAEALLCDPDGNVGSE